MMGKSRLLSKLRTEVRRQNYSYSTEQAYADWVKRYVQFHSLSHPQEMAEPEVIAYLNYLAEERQVAVAAQNQALSALLFLYKFVLHQPLQKINGLEKPLSHDEKEA
ncbi:site-specific integrase [Fodinibius salsisoli]|uniref:Phage integrase N-terminal SAM-like domain-containing protein n=1 Tax=Fodinibius salsisoli TaxID=2820877 RepID=A0ABT3PKD6_9BACT|nr:site-specific integrase [Fodinibius salsisoli]MCW9706382.1 phage integrase N-terminal SAM-like domain-containing protein [Fodinibius salsisoli]